MAILSVHQKQSSGSINNLWQRTYKRVFVVETDSPKVGPVAVRSASGIPNPGTSYTNGLSIGDPYYEFDNGSFVQSIDVEQGEVTQDGGIQWEVTVTYGPYDTSQFGNDPTLWPIKVSFGGDRTEKVVYFDRNGDPIHNSAGDPFDPPITIDDTRVTLTVTRNELVSAFSLATPETFNDTINDDSWNGFAPRTVKLGMITTSEPQYDSNNHVYYYTVTYPFMINRDGWQKKILDAGCNELDAYGKSKPIMNQSQQVSDPVPLDGMGHRIETPYATDPVTLTFDAYDEADFDALGIDLDTRLGA